MKKKWVISLLIISVIIIILSSYNIIKWFIDNNNTNDMIDNINYITDIEIVDDNINTQIIEENPYFDYINMNLIDVNFANLKDINNEVTGWIQVNGTNINYPFVQSNDNEYYLTHSFDKSLNNAGWVFMDFRNNIDNLDRNTIIYAHSRNNKTMFGSLNNVLNDDWYNNKDNHLIKISTESMNSLWQIFSVYVIPTTSDYLKISFNNNEEFMEFSNMLIERSKYSFNTTINENDLIITLSTCYNTNERLVVHAKLVKYSLKN